MRMTTRRLVWMIGVVALAGLAAALSKGLTVAVAPCAVGLSGGC
jgi:Flp pilus assembly protein CpaB